MTSAFARRLGALGLTVRELTGDMQLTRKELQETQMIVTTPEKWDVVTRKACLAYGDKKLPCLHVLRPTSVEATPTRVICIAHLHGSSACVC